MKHVLWFFIVVLLTGCAKPGFNLADGTTLTAGALQDKWLVINYWAEWCAPCRVEIPELNRLQSERGNKDLIVLGVNFDDVSGADLLQLQHKMGIQFGVLTTDPGSRWQAARPTVLPTTLLIDPAGTLHTILVGPQTRQTLENAMGLSASL